MTSSDTFPAGAGKDDRRFLLGCTRMPRAISRRSRSGSFSVEQRTIRATGLLRSQTEHLLALLHHLDVSAEFRFQNADVHNTHNPTIVDLTMLVTSIRVSVVF